MKDSNTHLAERWFLRWQYIVRHALSTRLSRAQDIDDLAQEVYLRLLRVPRPDLVKNPKAYMYRVALNVEYEWQHRSAQTQEHSPEWLMDLPAEETPDREQVQKEQADATTTALASLPATTRTAIVLHTRDAMTYPQIAAHMGVTRRAVKRHIAVGYATLREQLADFNQPGETVTSKERPHVE